MLFHFLTLSLIFLSLLFPPVLSDIQEGKNYQCSLFCSCVQTNNPWRMRASCNVTGSEDKSTPFLFGSNFSCITELDLSHTNLKHLNLKIFRNLTALTKLTLAFNDMRSWHGDPIRDLPNLVYLNVTGNPKWLPGNELSMFPRLRMIYGVWWRKECGHCSLEREVLETNASYLSNESRRCAYNGQNFKIGTQQLNESFQTRLANDKGMFKFSNDVEYGQLFDFTSQGNIVECEHELVCWYYESTYMWEDVLFEVLTVISYVQYVLGAFAMLSNFVVMATVVAKEKLRTSASFVLVGILAASDFLTGLYSVIQAKFTSYIVFNRLQIMPHWFTMYRVTCDISGYIFTTAQVTSPMTSLLLTIERYLVIVYGLNPEKRLTRKRALMCSLIVWAIAMVTAALPFFADRIRYHGMSHCSFLNTFETGASGVVNIVVIMATGILVIPYVIGIILYQRMHSTVKKLGQKMGHRADAKVAKNIALIVVSNLVFFVIPNVLLYLHANLLNLFENEILLSVRANIVYFIVFICLPLLCFNINACLNPFLFALRNDTFKQQLKDLVTRICACTTGNISFYAARSKNHRRGQQTTHNTNGENGKENPAVENIALEEIKS